MRAGDASPRWLGWRGSNARMQESKSCALPLGDIPKWKRVTTVRKRPGTGTGPFPGVWGGIWGSNPRHPEPQSGALPTELIPPHVTLSPFKAPGAPGGTRTPGLLLRRQLLYPAELLARIPTFAKAGAGEGNRTLVPSLEGWYSTIELHPQAKA